MICDDHVQSRSHGFDNATTPIAHRGPLVEALDQERLRLRIEDERRNAAIRVALQQVPRFDLPHRTYYLTPRGSGLGGHPDTRSRIVGRVATARPVLARRPTMVHRDRRGLLVAHIGGDHDLITEVARSVPTRSEIVALDHQLEIED